VCLSFACSLEGSQLGVVQWHGAAFPQTNGQVKHFGTFQISPVFSKNRHFAPGQQPMTYTPADSAPEHRTCQHCHNAYPISHFRRRTPSGTARMNQCRLCHNQAERLRRQHRSGRLTRRQFNQCLTSLKNQRTARGVERVYLGLIDHLGGAEGLMHHWTKSLVADLAAGGFPAYRQLAAIIRLMQHYEAAHPDKPDYSTLSDEELLDRLARAEAFGQ
jgi:hypothetical protein